MYLTVGAPLCSQFSQGENRLTNSHHNTTFCSGKDRRPQGSKLTRVVLNVTNHFCNAVYKHDLPYSHTATRWQQAPGLPSRRVEALAPAGWAAIYDG